MPLIKGKSRAAFSQNVATERAAGKPLDQSLAIAYRQAGEDRDGKRRRRNALADAIRKGGGR